MAKDSRIRMPSSQGGLVTYYDQGYRSKFQIKPTYVIGLCVILIVLFTILNVVG